MTKFEKQLKDKILLAADNDLAAITPGLCLQVVHKGRLKADLQLGQTYKYYDLASLTKVIFTVSATMQAYEQKKINLQQSLTEYLPWWPHRTVTPRQLLTHTGGLPWWAPFYKTLRRDSGLKKNSNSVLEKKREHLRKILMKTERVGEGLKSPGGRKIKAVYSDIDFIMLGFVLEAVNECSLNNVWQNLNFLEKTPGLHFNLNNHPKYKRSIYAPTEKCPWRKKILQGEVHDDNTWSMGGLSSHAGLFGSIDDVTMYGHILRNAYLGASSKAEKWLAKQATVQKFTRRAIRREQGDWALGFILPTRGAASCGRYFHATSFGHTGFTGTSIWYDPQQDLLVTILANRVHPTRENTRYVQFRPQIHNIICETLSV